MQGIFYFFFHLVVVVMWSCTYMDLYNVQGLVQCMRPCTTYMNLYNLSTSVASFDNFQCQLSYIYFFLLSSSSLPSLLFSFLSLLFSYLFFLFFFVSFFFLQIRAQVAITLVGILERRSRGKFFQNLVVKHGRKMLLISR